MPKRLKHALVAVAALATIGLGAAALVQASTDAAEKDENVTGAQADKATAAALRATKGGTAQAVEREGDGRGTWEVEVTKPGGGTVEIELDENLKVVAEERDGSEGEREGS